MKKLLILLLFIPFFAHSQQAFYGTRQFVSIDGADTLELSYKTDTIYFSSTDSVYFEKLMNTGGSGSVSLGTDNQIPFTNSTGTDFDYSSNFEWNGNTLELEADSGMNNVFVGAGVGANITSGSYNTFIGLNAGNSIADGSVNTFIGFNSGASCIGGDGNIYIGRNAGVNNSSGNTNVIIGRNAGTNSSGSNNIFLGTDAGFSETGSNKLYIENSNSSTPLIYGEFDNDLIKINGTLEAKQTMHVAKAEVLYTNTTQTTIITLPDGAVVWDMGVEVITGFNDSGTNILYFGITGDFDALMEWPNSIGSKGFTKLSIPYKSSGTDITFTYTGENGDATQGQAFVYIHYSLH